MSAEAKLRPLAQQLIYLLGELHAGNAYSKETLWRWLQNAERDYRLATPGGTSVDCPHCHWGFDRTVIDQHIREKHS